MNFLQMATEIEPQIIAWRREIHQYPELGFEETRTANLVANALREMGVEVETGVGRTGVVARFGNGNGRKVGIRADMDALPIQEAVDLPFASTTPGKMHACGHDAHTAMLMGVAKVLQAMPEINGEIRLLFQPSEERWDADGVSGATAMIADKALDDLDAVIAIHVNSLLPVGQIEVTDGMALAAVDTFTATIFGVGCHGAMPHVGIDPIWISAQVINAVQSIRSRRTNPTSGSVVTIGSIHAGDAPNVIPDRVQLNGTIRSFAEAVVEACNRPGDGAIRDKTPQGALETRNHEPQAVFRRVDAGHFGRSPRVGPARRDADDAGTARGALHRRRYEQGRQAVQGRMAGHPAGASQADG